MVKWFVGSAERAAEQHHLWVLTEKTCLYVAVRVRSHQLVQQFVFNLTRSALMYALLLHRTQTQTEKAELFPVSSHFFDELQV